MKHLVSELLAIAALLVSCDTENASNIYSTKYRVAFYYEVSRSPELFNTMGSPGMFASIRQVNGKIRIADVSGKYTDYAPDKVQVDFRYGLGGLIVGNTYMQEYVAYDLACPNCDRQKYRLSFDSSGRASCSHCGTMYDLNNNGWILSTRDSVASDLRALYRYRIVYNGLAVNVYN
ncbi:MAG: hypothetical protein MJY59_01760 [Bacteroidaceae bacterium]|nr:hypothetical protein [Bacteroidaceae bacterium]